MPQDNNNSSRPNGGQNKNHQGGNNQNRNRNRNRNRNNNSNNNRPNNGGNRQENNRQGGGQKRYTKPMPLTFWEKTLKFLGLYKAPTRPPRRQPNNKTENTGENKTTQSSPRNNNRGKKQNAKSQTAGYTKKTPKSFPVEAPRLYLGNLSYDATEHDLEDLFKGVGTVRKVEIVYNKHTHRSKGYGFIEMLSVEEAKKAVEVLHEQPFMGRNLVVNGASARPKNENKPQQRRKPASNTKPQSEETTEQLKEESTQDSSKPTE